MDSGKQKLQRYCSLCYGHCEPVWSVWTSSCTVPYQSLSLCLHFRCGRSAEEALVAAGGRAAIAVLCSPAKLRCGCGVCCNSLTTRECDTQTVVASDPGIGKIQTGSFYRYVRYPSHHMAIAMLLQPKTVVEGALCLPTTSAGTDYIIRQSELSSPKCWSPYGMARPIPRSSST